MIDIHQEPDRVPRRPLMVSFVAVLVAIAACVGVTVLLIGRQLGRLSYDGSMPAAQIDTELYTREAEGEQARRAAHRQLSRWGWIDRRAGTIHVPLDVAIELYLAAPRSTP
ncbi:MAG: hypothetical protein AB7P03_25160 [Kofleriaceae bacterium]